MRDLPAGVIRMNDECLKLRDHTAGYQTVEDIQAVVGEAIGLHPKPLADDDYIDEAMARPSPVCLCVPFRSVVIVVSLLEDEHCI